MADNQFEENELKQIDKANDLKISPFRADGETYGTPTWIWAVVVDGDLYVRAYHGKSSRWYQSAVKQKAGRIHAAGMVKEVRFEAAAADLNDSIDNAYRKKYSNSLYLSYMVSSRSQEAKVKITPR